jgi:hypothetical protein
MHTLSQLRSFFRDRPQPRLDRVTPIDTIRTISQNIMSTPQNTNTRSGFEHLPPELMNTVMSQLVGPNCPSPEPQVTDDDVFALTVRNKPKFSTAILRITKQLHPISKSYLDIENR